MGVVMRRMANALWSPDVLRTGAGLGSLALVVAGIGGAFGWPWALIAAGMPGAVFYIWGEVRRVRGPRAEER